jgi:dTDP-4-amino-4,6-dideoxygalactose transaminase
MNGVPKLGHRKVRLSKCSVGAEEKEAVVRVLDSEFLGMGAEVQAFEQEIKAFLETPFEVICVNTGTAALHLAVESIGLGDGDEVLIPAITYVASFQAVSAARAKPVACDVLEDSLFIDLKDAETRITKRTKAIMPVHFASDSSQMVQVYEFAKKHHLRVIEDAAHSFGGGRGHKKIGAEGDIICFSFDGIKNITSGEGGAIVTGDMALAQRAKDARLLGVEKDTEKRFQGKRSWVFDVKHQGYRYHMSDLMAAIGRAQLKKINHHIHRRKHLVQLYLKELESVPGLVPLNLDYKKIVPHIFVVKVKQKERDHIAEQLQAMGVATGIHYYPNHVLSLYKTSYSLPMTEKVMDQMMTLPLHPDLVDEDVMYVCQCLRQIFES